MSLHKFKKIIRLAEAYHMREPLVYAVGQWWDHYINEKQES